MIRLQELMSVGYHFVKKSEIIYNPDTLFDTLNRVLEQINIDWKD